SDGGILAWDLGSLAPTQERRIELQVVPESRTPFSCQAQATFTAVSSLNVQVREPKLALKAAAQEKVILGDTATVALTVTNAGDGLAERVKVKAVLPEGMEHARGKQVEVELGNLVAGESRTVQMVCLTRAAGAHAVECSATAEAGLTAQDVARLE